MSVLLTLSLSLALAVASVVCSYVPVSACGFAGVNDGHRRNVAPYSILHLRFPSLSPRS